MKDQRVIVRLLVDARNFYILWNVQTESGTTTALHAIGIIGSSAREVKRPGPKTDDSISHSCTKLKNEWRCTPIWRYIPYSLHRYTLNFVWILNRPFHMWRLGSLPVQPFEICGEQSGIVDVFPADSLILDFNIVTATFIWFSYVIQRTKIGLLEFAIPQGHKMVL
jgi:hypothetical protein